MPCDSSHLEATDREEESLAIVGFLKEVGLFTGKYDRCYGRVSQLDKDTRMLCAFLRTRARNFPEGIRDYSLELQLWWRDHQKADRKKAAEKKIAFARGIAKAKAIAKLTPAERKLFGER